MTASCVITGSTCSDHLCSGQSIWSSCAVNQSCPWDGLTHGFGWVGLGRDFSVFGGLDWIGSTIAKVL